MAEYYEMGAQLRDLLSGLLGLGEPQAKAWGPRIETRELQDIYAPQESHPLTPSPPGIDNLSLSSIDRFVLPGQGELEVNFKGFFRVARAKPTTDNWATAETYVNMVEIRLQGESEIGPISVGLNPDFVSAGQVIPPGKPNTVAKCRIAAGVTFTAPDMGMTLFNKEPILLMNDGITAVPPVEDPNGSAHIYYLPLYDLKQPDARPVGYLTSLKYTVGSYLTQEEVASLRG